MSANVVKAIAVLLFWLASFAAQGTDAWSAAGNLSADIPLASFGTLSPVDFSQQDLNTPGSVTFSATYSPTVLYHELHIYPFWSKQQKAQNGLSMVPKDWPTELMLSWGAPKQNANGYWSMVPTPGTRTYTDPMSYQLYGLTPYTPTGSYTFTQTLSAHVVGCNYQTWAPGQPYWINCTDLGTNVVGYLTVTLRLGSDCRIETAALNFGTVAATGPTFASSGTNVWCASGTPYRVTFSAGASGNANARAMRRVSGNDTLPYSLFRDAGRTIALNASTAISGVGTGATTFLPIYGAVPSASGVPAGNYSDTLTMTLEY